MSLEVLHGSICMLEITDLMMVEDESGKVSEVFELQRVPGKREKGFKWREQEV